MDPTLTSKSDTTEENLGQFGTGICIAFGTARFLCVLYGVSVSLHASLQPSLHYLLFVGGTLPREHCMVAARVGIGQQTNAVIQKGSSKPLKNHCARKPRHFR